MSELSNIKSTLLAEQVQEQLYQYILDNHYEIGTKIPNEFELARYFGVGRSTIREAVKLLISKGVLEVRRGSGPGSGKCTHYAGTRHCRNGCLKRHSGGY